MGNFIEITCEGACNKLKRKIPYGWDLNIYRGCQHGCKYCYAQYSHKYLDNNDFFNDIYVKTNILEKLEKELSSSAWKRDVINIGGVTDSYQPIESKYKLMPEVLKLLIKYKTPAIISTKSDLILRDYDLIDELSRVTYVNIASTITTIDEGIRKDIEPFGVATYKRFEMLKEFRKTEVSTGLHVMPIIPFLTDNYENINGIFSSGKECGVSYVLPGVLYLRGATRANFFEFIKKSYPDLYIPLLQLYRTGGAGKEYKDNLYKMVNEVREKYELSNSYMKPMNEKLKPIEYTQLSMF